MKPSMETLKSTCAVLLSAFLTPAFAMTSGITIPKGTVVDLLLEDAVSSRTARVGDTFRASLVRPLYVAGELALSQGTVVEGRVDAVKSLRNGARSGFVGLEFVRILLPGAIVKTKISARLTDRRQDDRPQWWMDDPSPPIDTVLIGPGASAGKRALALVGDDLADTYSKTRLSESDVDLAAGTFISMEFEEDLKVPPDVAMAKR